MLACTQAFLHATSSPRDLHWSNAALAVFSAAHLGVCALLVPALGVRGALLAGAINMAMRIAWSFSFVTRVYRGRQRAWLASALPSGRLLVSLGTAAAVLRISGDMRRPHTFRDAGTAVSVSSTPTHAPGCHRVGHCWSPCYCKWVVSTCGGPGRVASGQLACLDFLPVMARGKGRLATRECVGCGACPRSGGRPCAARDPVGGPGRCPAGTARDVSWMWAVGRSHFGSWG